MRNKKGQFIKGNEPWFIKKGLKNPTNGVVWNKGIKYGDKTRKKISTAISSLWKNPDYRKMMSLKHKGKLGEKASNWQGGITPENTKIRNSIEFALWRKSVFARNNFTCQCCSNNGGILHAHHINNFADFPELRLNIENGITLCKKCHNNFHKKYMRKNNTREQLVEFFDGTNGFLTIA